MIVDIGALKLSTQRALLGRVTPNLRAVCVLAEENLISGIFYHDKGISVDEFEFFEQAKDVICADFCQPQGQLKEKQEFCLETVQLDYPKKMSLKGHWVYYRYEAAAQIDVELTEESPGSPCPCCGYLTLSGPPGTYEICPVCNWEDDYDQFRDPSYKGGANKESLNEARENYKKIGAALPRFLKQVRPPKEDEIP